MKYRNSKPFITLPKSHFGMFLLLLAMVALSIGTSRLQALDPDVEQILLINLATFEQDSVYQDPDNTGTLSAFSLIEPYDRDQITINSALLEWPNGSDYYYYLNNQRYYWAQQGAISNGVYWIQINGDHNGTRTFDLQMYPDITTYPAPSKITDLDEDYNSLEISWEDFSDWGPDDFILLAIQVNKEVIWQSSFNYLDSDYIDASDNSIDIALNDMLKNDRLDGRTAEIRLMLVHVVDRANPYGIDSALAAYVTETLIEYEFDGNISAPWETQLTFEFNHEPGFLAQESGSTFSGNITYPPPVFYRSKLSVAGSPTSPDPQNVVFSWPFTSSQDDVSAIESFNETVNGASFESFRTDYIAANGPGSSFPDDGIYEVDFDGLDLEFDMADPDAEDRQPVIVPEVDLDFYGEIDEISWTFRTLRNQSIWDNDIEEYVTDFRVIVGKTNGTSVTIIDVDPTADSIDINALSIDWDTVARIGFQFAAVDGHIYKSEFETLLGLSEADYSSISLSKKHLFRQDARGVVERENPYGIETVIESDNAALINEASLEYGSPSSSIGIYDGDGSLTYFEAASSEIYPDGEYVFTIDSFHFGERELPVAMNPGDTRYPSANIPALTSYSSAQLIDAGETGGYLLSWDGFTDADSSDDYIQIQLLDTGETVILDEILNYNVTGYVIPENTLEHESIYTLKLAFVNVVTRGTAVIGNKDIDLMGTYVSETVTTIRTLPESAGPINIAAWLSKESNWLQTSESSLEPANDGIDSFRFFSSVEGLDLVEARLLLPDLSVTALPSYQGATDRYEWDEYFDEGEFSPTGNLDAAFPDGEYRFVFNLNENFEISQHLNLDASGSIKLKITNFDELLYWQSDEAKSIAWSGSQYPYAYDFIQIEIIETATGQSVFLTPGPYEPEALGGIDSCLIPADVLEPWTDYEIILSNYVISDYVSFDETSWTAAKVNRTRAPVYTQLDISGYGINKNRSFFQADSSTLMEVPDNSRWRFRTYVDETYDNAVNLAAIEKTGFPETRINLTEYEKGWELLQPFLTRPDLESQFPDNTSYTLTIDTSSEGIYYPVFELGNPAYPVEAPFITNYEELQAVDASMDTTIAWSYFKDSMQPDIEASFIQASAYINLPDGSNQLIHQSPLLDRQTQSYSLPEGILEDGTEYMVEVVFNNVTAVNESDYPGVTGYAGYSVTTETVLKTTQSNTLKRASVIKQSRWSQIHQSFVSLSQGGVGTDKPFAFSIWLDGDDIQSARFLPYGYDDPVLLPHDTANEWGFLSNFDAADEEPYSATLDATYPEGDYEITITFSDQNVITQTVSVINDYPPAPKVSNFDDLQQWETIPEWESVPSDPDLEPYESHFLITWDQWTDDPDEGFIQIIVNDPNTDTEPLLFSSPGPCQYGALPANAHSISIPAFELPAPRVYEIKIVFYKVTQQIVEAGSENNLFTVIFASQTTLPATSVLSYDDWAAMSIPDPGQRGFFDDPDQDWADNILEYLSASDPDSAMSRPIHETAYINGYFRVKFTTLVGVPVMEYTSWQRTPDLLSEPWSTIYPSFTRNTIEAESNTFETEFWFNISAGVEQLFYRMIIDTADIQTGQ